MKYEVLVVTPIPPELWQRLSRNYKLVDNRPEGDERRNGVPVIVTTSVVGADRRLMDALPDLKLIACNGAGLEKIDLEAARERGITVQHTPDAVTEDTADSVIGLIYATVRRIAEADRFVRAGNWKTGRMSPSRRVFSRSLGIVGLGKIGNAIARRASAIGMTVSYSGPNEKSGVPYPYVADVRALAHSVDILALSCPGGPETKNLIDREILAALGPEGYLINASRGSVVNQNDLVDALKKRTIAGAGLDVFDNEPDIDPQFLTLDNAVLQPHVAAVTVETRHAIADVLEKAIDTHFSGKPLH